VGDVGGEYSLPVSAFEEGDDRGHPPSGSAGTDRARRTKPAGIHQAVDFAAADAIRSPNRGPEAAACSALGIEAVHSYAIVSDFASTPKSQAYFSSNGSSDAASFEGSGGLFLPSHG
jgi:hypothetical protein